MTFHQKNTLATLVSFSVLLMFFGLRVLQLILSGKFEKGPIIQLWIIVAVLAVVVTVLGIILTHVVPHAIDRIKNKSEATEIDDLIDERDQRIDREGTVLTYRITSIGTFIAMLTYALGQPALVMFTLVVFFGLSGQIGGDILRLKRYRED
jgi:hypothetical protein